MKKRIALFEEKRAGKKVFLFTGFVSAYWVMSWLFNIYQFAIAGAVYELLWLPILLCTFLLPLLCIFFWLKEKFKLTSYYFFALLLMSIVISIYLYLH